MAGLATVGRMFLHGPRLRYSARHLGSRSLWRILQLLHGEDIRVRVLGHVGNEVAPHRQHPHVQAHHHVDGFQAFAAPLGEGIVDGPGDTERKTGVVALWRVVAIDELAGDEWVHIGFHLGISSTTRATKD